MRTIQFYPEWITDDVAQEFLWTPAGDSEHLLYKVGVDTSGMAVEAESERGHGWPPESEFVEATPNARSNTYRASTWGSRVYSFNTLLFDDDRSEYERLLGQWQRWHNPMRGQGVLKRITARGLVRCLDCKPRVPGAIEKLWGHCGRFRQEYLAADPWWRTEDMKSVEGVFSSAGPVYLQWQNDGDVEAWPVITVRGEATNPRIDNANGDIMRILKITTNDDDTIMIDCRPNTGGRQSVWFYEHGTGSGTPCSLSSDSRFWLLPTGASTVTLRCDGGKPGCLLQAHDYYGSLY